MDGIASDMVARDPDVTRLVDRLEKAGLVERRRSEDDRRVVLVRITPKGRALLRRLHDPVLALHRKQLAALGRERLRALSDLLAAARHAAAPD
jgi:DNA-binding MarR family transcriptional regulator